MLPCWMITMDERKASGNGGKETQAVFEEQTKIGPEPSTPFTEENEGIVCVQEDPGEEFDFDDVEVAPADGMLIKHNDDEVRLLFFYIKPNMRTSNGTSVCKAVTELRIPRRAFLLMADDIRQAAAGLQKSHTDASPPMYA